ncbi:hypothetical protein AK812_SmicGene29361 [Symbiodinium microadriaticum]|uniref:Uncharacterized protein n=1 Tax=Symbiodinium microadriaticum TaxID=2951 RepID=A0A1Q9D218_SYMMI|nr:hypothetical protein AK812_SmicGene29361 [Symbiodinium microadriaticum]
MSRETSSSEGHSCWEDLDKLGPAPASIALCEKSESSSGAWLGRGADRCAAGGQPPLLLVLEVLKMRQPNQQPPPLPVSQRMLDVTSIIGSFGIHNVRAFPLGDSFCNTPSSDNALYASDSHWTYIGDTHCPAYVASTAGATSSHVGSHWDRDNDAISGHCHCLDYYQGIARHQSILTIARLTINA